MTAQEEASRTLASSSAMWGGGRGAVADDGPTAMMVGVVDEQAVSFTASGCDSGGRSLLQEVDPPSCLPRESAARSARGCVEVATCCCDDCGDADCGSRWLGGGRGVMPWPG